MSVKLVTDSTSYIDTAIQQELDITVIPLSVHFPDESFVETEVAYDYFYGKIDQTGIIPTSSQPAQGEICAAFEDIVSRGDDVLAIFISSDMSGTYESALIARGMTLQKYPGARIEVLDSRTNCMALGLPVLESARAASNGTSLNEVKQLARHLLERIRFYFVPSGLEYLKKGGRIGGAAALIGSILSIKPILWVDNGKTALLEKTRGARAALGRLLSLLDNDFKAHGLKYVLVHHIHCPEKAAQLAHIIKSRYGMEVPILSIGPVIGLHVGPGAIGIVYCTEE